MFIPPPPVVSIPAPPPPPVVSVPAPPPPPVISIPAPPPPPIVSVPAPPPPPVVSVPAPPPPPVISIPAPPPPPIVSVPAPPPPPPIVSVPAPPPPPPVVSVPAPPPLPVVSVPAPPPPPPVVSVPAPPPPPPVVSVPAPPPPPVVSIPAPPPPPVVSVPAPPPQPPPQSQVNTAIIIPAAPITVEKWKSIETEARTRIPNQARTRYLRIDEIIRDNVATLFVQSKYDVLTLLTNVVNSLQQLGRHDLCLMRNENHTAFTIMQHSAHGLYSHDILDSSEMVNGVEEQLIEQRRRETAYAIERVNQAGSFYNARLEEIDRKLNKLNKIGIAESAAGASANSNAVTVSCREYNNSNKTNSNNNTTTTNNSNNNLANINNHHSLFEKTVYEKIMEKMARRERRQKQRERQMQESLLQSECTSLNTYNIATNKQYKKVNSQQSCSHKSNNSNSSCIDTCNSYSGNYILNRYGRSYNPERSYSHYKLYGLPRVL